MTASAPEFTFTSMVAPVCQIGMSANRQPEPDSWLDVSCYVHQVEAFRGRDRFTDRFQPGTASITFSNEDGWGDLVGVGPAVAAETLRPGRPIRVGLTGTWITGTDTRWLFRGWIDQCVPRYDPVEHDVVDVNCVDALGESGSQPAPQGPFQGANEVVHARIHRVLDAVGWFAPKRKVFPSATTVQGTQLGSQGIDLMGVAADSAGGVVYGDLDGDVVYRDLNWELYASGTPPDGTIGNVDPGTPGIPYTPGYLDPAVGYVYWTDPPPFDRPSVIRVCASAGDGSLVAQGDLKVSVVGGQLRFESLGHVWNMGGFDGGCVEIASCTPDDPTTPPVRYDLGTARADSWVLHTEPAIEIAATPTVEFLYYTDAGLSDPPAASITPGPIEPGPGGLLVVLFTAIGSATVDPRLDATLSGGGLTWRLVDHADAWDGGASSWIWVAEVGRRDPGLFSLSISWTGTIRSHACTVWRVTKYAAGYMAQVAAGFANRAVTHSDGALEVIQPGDGPQAITLGSATSATDVTIAQSLAEEGTPPYGAVFDDSDGVWTVPPLPSHLPPVALRAAARPVPVLRAADAAPPFRDDFDRADGPLGANWLQAVQDPNPPGGTCSINAGAVIADVIATHCVYYYATPIPGPHYVEMEIAGWKSSGASGRGCNIGPIVRGHGPADATFNIAAFAMRNDQTGGWIMERYYNAGGPGPFSVNDVSPADTFRLRLESTPDPAGGFANKLAWYIDDILVAHDDYDEDNTPPGDYVGFWLNWASSFGGGDPAVVGPSPRINWVEAGAVGLCDDFERADIGTDWTLGPPPDERSESVTGSIVDGKIVGPLDVNGGPDLLGNLGVSLMTTASFPGDQSVDAVFGNLWQGQGIDTTGMNVEGNLYLYCHANATDKAQIAAWIQPGLTGPFENPEASGELFVILYQTDTGGFAQTETTVDGTYPVSAPTTNSPATIRLETTAAGHAACFIDDTLVVEGDFIPYTGDRVGFGFNWHAPSYSHLPVPAPPEASFWVDEACVNQRTGGSGAPHKTSWVAGWRTDASSPVVAWSDVNTGPTDLQSSQAALVVDGNTSGDTPNDDTDLVIGGTDNRDPFTGNIYDVERREGCDPDTGDVVWLFDPNTDAPWGGFTPSDPDAVIPSTPASPLRPGDACPQTWDESADRSQMTTQVMIARQSPSNIPPLTYNFPGANPPNPGEVVLNAAQSEATVIRVHKTMNTGADSTIWLRYLHTNDRVRFADADDTGVAVGYVLTGEPAEAATFFDLPVVWQDGQNPVPAGVTALTLSLLPQPPHLFYDAFGVPLYGVETLSRTDLINTSEDLLPTLADRILEVRGSNSIPRVEAVTLDARTGGFNQPTVMHLMSTAAPERPSRYRMRLQVNERPIYDRVCFVNSVRHFVSRDEWTVRLALDVAEWAAQL